MTPDDDAPQHDYLRSFNEESDTLPNIDTDLFYKEFGEPGGEPKVIETREPLPPSGPAKRPTKTGRPPPEPNLKANPDASESGELSGGSDSSTSRPPQNSKMPFHSTDLPERVRHNHRPLRETRKNVNYKQKSAETEESEFTPMLKPLKD